MYAAENRISILSRYFAGLAILIYPAWACSGSRLIPPSAGEEIGVRKVVGASIGNVVMMLSAIFSSWCSISGANRFPAGMVGYQPVAAGSRYHHYPRRRYIAW